MESPKPLPSPPTNPEAIEATGRKARLNSAAHEEDEFEFFHEFSRDKVKGLIHLITQELKTNAINIEFLFLPFRPEQSNEKLLKFLNQIFPLGNGVPVNEAKQARIIGKTEPWTLFQALKYVWCRLPEGQVVTWKAYEAFRVREQGDGYRSRSFLELMPKCLSSPDHASIVYDFFDLIVTASSNSKHNKMSARKVSKMFGIWAFRSKVENSPYDFGELTSETEKKNSFAEGVEQWIPASDAMFHLLLAFIRSFISNDLKDANIPTSLKTILFNSTYPPKGSTAYDSETILTVPIVSLKTTEFSKKPWRLIERCNELFDFSNYNAFEAREDYALLKSLFKRRKNIDGISHKMSKESRRIMKEISTKHSTFQAGWAFQKCVPPDEGKTKLETHLEMGRVDIDDYFIWAWLSTLSHEQTSDKKKLFGRSLILEFEFDGFKKWVIIEECDLNLEMKKHKKLDSLEYLKPRDNHEQLQEQQIRTITPAYEKFQHNVKDDRPSQNSTLLTSSPQNEKLNVGEEISPAHVQDRHHKRSVPKWNPLKSIRKKSGGGNSSSSPLPQASSEQTKDSSAYKNKELPPSPSHEQASNRRPRDDSRVLSQFSMLNPENYKLPTIEHDDFKIEIPDIEEDSIVLNPKEAVQQPDIVQNDGIPSPHANGGIEDLNEMVDELSNQVKSFRTNGNQSPKSLTTNAETFETLTMFEKYKGLPKNSTDTLAGSINSNTVPPLQLDSPRIETIPGAFPTESPVRRSPQQSFDSHKELGSYHGNQLSQANQVNETDKVDLVNQVDQVSPIVFPVDYDQDARADISPVRSRGHSPVRKTPYPQREFGMAEPKFETQRTDIKQASPPPSQSYIHYEKHMPTSEKRGGANRDFAHHTTSRTEYECNNKSSLREAPVYPAQTQFQTKDGIQIAVPGHGPHSYSNQPYSHYPDQSAVPAESYGNSPVGRREHLNNQANAPNSGNPRGSNGNRNSHYQVPYGSPQIAHQPGAVASYEAQEPSYPTHYPHYPVNAANNQPHRPVTQRPNHSIPQPFSKVYSNQPQSPPTNIHPRFPPQHARQHPHPRLLPQTVESSHPPQVMRPYASPQMTYASPQMAYAPVAQGATPTGFVASPSPNPAYYGTVHSPPAPQQAPFISGVPVGGKLHGAYAKKREDRKKLHDTIKNGTFGI
ncbi:LAQU0S02e09494g1_1 [Lachancea quebecensis]|uniref:LAQU0S02e09494g1_1 n=1 Tax=Lachancea quebecensis TaxID=1654605 RepID=A0A0P1KYB6_9SACH|nr:LAQU0S02e09494g1_1 [Lachancea quebecensis]